MPNSPEWVIDEKYIVIDMDMLNELIASKIGFMIKENNGRLVMFLSNRGFVQS